MRLLLALMVSVLSGEAFLALAQTAADRPAEEATLLNGRRLSGTLALDNAGRLRFTPSKGDAPLAFDRIQHVRFPPAAAFPLRAGMAHRLHLPDGQQLTGELLGFEEQTVRLRTAWSASLSVPRPAVVALTHLPGFVTFFAEDFEGELKPWKLTGSPGFSEQHTSGKRGLVLGNPGQAVAYALAAPLEEGRAGVNFLDEAAAGAVWLIEAEFQTAEKSRVVRVTLAGDGDAYKADLPGAENKLEAVRRTTGWHRLELGFTRGSLRVTVDDAVLGFNLKQGPGGPLRRLRLACLAAGTAVPRGRVVFDDFSLARAVDEPRRSAGDSTQDEVWLLSGDQVFGQLVRTDRQGIELRNGGRTHRYPWGEARGLFPRRSTLPPQTTDGEHVRVWLRSGAGPETDQLEGVLLALDDRKTTLQHAILGKLDLDRVQLHQLRWLFHGRRIELDNAFHHLGDKDRVVPVLQPPRAEGTSLQRTFHLDAVPWEARLVVQVVYLHGADGGIEAARKRGEPLTEVLLNGRHVDYLNRFVDRPLAEPTRSNVALPRDALQKGKNVVEIRQLPGKESGRHANCGVFGLVVEVPR
jgi:hypothetical protein